jgi:SAM-dependent methyltransferase
MKLFGGQYDEWRVSRFAGILKYVNIDLLFDKTLLELGCGYGDNGKLFKNIGCDVTASDANEQHIKSASVKNPELKYEIFNCNKDLLTKKYDIILHWAVVNHLDNLEQHLNNVCANCDYLFLESEICDASISYVIKTNESEYDQAFDIVGSRPSQKYIENILTKNNFNFVMIKDSILNAGYHIYDWEIRNSLTCHNGMRRYWICWNKNVSSPLK